MMTKLRMPTRLRYVVIGVAVTVLAGGWLIDRSINPTYGVDCRGPQHIEYRSSASGQQKHVFSCYIRALARRDQKAMQHMTAPGFRIQNQDLAMATSAAHGTVVVDIDRSFSTGYPWVTYTFADGKTLAVEAHYYHGQWRPEVGADQP